MVRRRHAAPLHVYLDWILELRQTLPGRGTARSAQRLLLHQPVDPDAHWSAPSLARRLAPGRVFFVGAFFLSVRFLSDARGSLLPSPDRSTRCRACGLWRFAKN